MVYGQSISYLSFELWILLLSQGRFTVITQLFSWLKITSGNQSKNINIKYLPIREHIKENQIIIKRFNIKLMIVNSLTKDALSKSFKDNVLWMRVGLMGNLYGIVFHHMIWCIDIFYNKFSSFGWFVFLILYLDFCWD